MAMANQSSVFLVFFCFKHSLVVVYLLWYTKEPWMAEGKVKLSCLLVSAALTQSFISLLEPGSLYLC